MNKKFNSMKLIIGLLVYFYFIWDRCILLIEVNSISLLINIFMLIHICKNSYFISQYKLF